MHANYMHACILLSCLAKKEALKVIAINIISDQNDLIFILGVTQEGNDVWVAQLRLHWRKYRNYY